MELNDSELAVTDNLGQTGLHSAGVRCFHREMQ